jgi:hypothetical protein
MLAFWEAESCWESYVQEETSWRVITWLIENKHFLNVIKKILLRFVQTETP